MTVERRRPLPPGRYWLDIFEPKRVAWEIWSTAMSRMDPPRVHIETTRHFEPDSGSTAHDFIIFTTAGETIYSDVLPSPNLAPATITTSDDTLTRPDAPPDVLDQLTEAASKVGTGAKIGLTIGIAIAVGALGVALFRR